MREINSDCYFRKENVPGIRNQEHRYAQYDILKFWFKISDMKSLDEEFMIQHKL